MESVEVDAAQSINLCYRNVSIVSDSVLKLSVELLYGNETLLQLVPNVGALNLASVHIDATDLSEVAIIVVFGVLAGLVGLHVI